MAVPQLALGPRFGRRRWRAVWVLLVVAALIVPNLAEPAAAAVATPGFVQARSKQVTSGTTNSLAFTKANTAGNLIVVAVMWSNTAAVSVADSRGNAYASPLARTTWGSGWSSQVFYAKNVAGGANTVTATFATAISSFGLLYIHEYSGIDKLDPLDVTKAATGTASAMTTGTVATTNASDLLFGAGASRGNVTQPGAGFTARSSAFGNMTMDRNVTVAGSYAATATQNSNAWVLQLVAFKASSTGGDSTAPSVSITAPQANTQVSDIVTVTANATDNVGVAGVQFLVDNTDSGLEDTTAPYGLSWDTRTLANGTHTLTARARDAAGNTSLSVPVPVTVNNTNRFQNEVLATGFNLPTNIEFLPDGRMLVVELQGTIKILPPPYTQPDPTPFLQLTNVGAFGVQQGLFDIVLDPAFVTNHFYYLFYTAATPNRDRLSRFTANATNTGTVAGSEVVLYQDPLDASDEHHGGALNFGNDGKLYFTTGEHFDAPSAQSLSSPRGKIHRINKDGTIPTDNPFYDGAGPNVDSIWALGLRNPFRAYYDAPSGKLYVGDVGGNDYRTAQEEVDLGARGANYGWPNCELGTCGNPSYTPALYAYAHNGRDAAITGGFVYHGTQFPSSYQGSYFFADYTQNWIRRLTFDANGNVNGVFNFEPADGTVDGPYGDIVYLTEGPDGALYYVDLGYSDVGGTFGVSKIRRIRYVQSNQPPVAVASANPDAGPRPLTVSFSSAGSSDPEGQPLSYAWTFGDSTSSTTANPSHTYDQAGVYTARLSVSDGVNTTLSQPLTITVGSPPTATILSPQDGATFRAGDVILFSGDGTDPDDGTLPASAFTWNIDFLHEGHVHPGTPVVGIKSGSFTVPTSGHDFSGFTRYRITLTVTDSNGLTATKSVTINPEKVNLSFDTVPSGRTIYLDGIARTTPFVYDTLVGFNHTIEARNQSSGDTSYSFASWSDGGAQQHSILVPATAQSYTATYTTSSAPPIGFVQVKSSTPQTAQSTVATAFAQAQTAGNLNAVAIGWFDSTGNITSVSDSAGNTYQVGAPTFRGNGFSQAVYYAKNIAGAPANTVTVRFDKALPYVDVRILEYSGLDRTSPLDVTSSATGTAAQASSGTATTNFARELVLGAGVTSASFTGPGTGFTTRIITSPDDDIAEDRTVTSAGAYAATAPQTGRWVMQMVTFKGAGQT